MSHSAAATVVDCFFYGNAAGWPGGGALHSDSALLTLHGVSCSGNSAPGGGGGALFWEGETEPKIISWCARGLYPDINHTCLPDDCAARCIPCATGNYQSREGAADGNACVPCAPGSYSSSAGATVCADCNAGTFSSIVGANSSAVCTLCSSGEFASSTGASMCSICSPGTFSSAESAAGCDSCGIGYYGAEYGNTVCSACEPGTYSAAGAASCDICSAGSYLPEGAVECVLCDAGSFSTSGGTVSATACTFCGTGSYSERRGEAGCVQCQAGKFSAVIGANSSFACIGCSEGKLSNVGSSTCINITEYRAGTQLKMNVTTESAAVALPFNISVLCSSFSTLTAMASPDMFLQFAFVSPFANNEYTIDIKMDGIANSDYPAALLQTCSRISSYLEWRADEEITLQWTNWDPEPSNWISPPCFFRALQTSFFLNSTLKLCYQLLSFADDVWKGETLSVGVYGDNYSFSAPQVTLDGLCLELSPDSARCGSYNVSIRPWLDTEVLIPVCPAGQYLTVDKSCTNCPAGTYQTSDGALSKKACTACAAGKYTIAAGASGPDACVEVTNSSELNETASCERLAARSYHAFVRKGQFSRKWRRAGLTEESESVNVAIYLWEEGAR